MDIRINLLTSELIEIHFLFCTIIDELREIGKNRTKKKVKNLHGFTGNDELQQPRPQMHAISAVEVE